MAGGRAVYIGGFNVGQHHHFTGFGQRLKLGGIAVFDPNLTVRDGFDQGVPGVAMGALAQPFGADAAAFVAGVDSFVFGHAADDTVCKYGLST